MKNIILVFLTMVLFIGVAVFWTMTNNDACSAGQYFSDYTQKCELATLQMGLGNEIESLTIDDLKSKFSQIEFSVAENPAYKELGTNKKERIYKGFSLKEIIESYVGGDADLSDYLVMVTCLDGFDPIIEGDILKQLNQVNGLLAVEQVSINSHQEELTKDGLWDQVKVSWGIISPGPFYLVWDQVEETYPSGWPFQIKSLRILTKASYAQLISQLRPSEEWLGKDPKSMVEMGFNQFKAKCLTCHNISGVGGQKAKVDLVEKVNLFSSPEESLSYVKAVIASPPAGMSDILDMKVSAEDIEQINLYLRAKAN